MPAMPAPYAPAAAAAPAAAIDPALGRVADRWRVVREIAQGGMGAVFEAFDEQTHQRCAIKVLKTGRTTPEQEERFRREADLGARLNGHPGIVATTAAGALPNGRLYCVMEFVDGSSLWEMFGKNVLTREQAVRLVLEVAQAVAFAHSLGIVHRDLKPQNVLVTREGRARLTDFGLAKALDDVHGLTATGQVMGTPRFMAPEQAEDSKRVDPRADVFGLGAILYTALTRRPPMDLQGLSIREALRRVLECKITPPLQHDPTIDRSIDALCRRALDRDPQRRPPSAEAFAAELEAWLAGDRTVREPAVDDDDDDEGGGKAKWVVLAALLLALLAGGIAAGFHLAR
jgi:serine/threonine protein kinase